MGRSQNVRGGNCQMCNFSLLAAHHRALCGHLVVLSRIFGYSLVGWVFKGKCRIQMLVTFFNAEEIHTTHHIIILDALLHHPLYVGIRGEEMEVEIQSYYSVVLLYIPNTLANDKLMLFLGDDQQHIYFLGSIN